MFSGIIQEIGTVAAITPRGGDVELTVAVESLEAGLEVGESIAVDGVCLTVTAFDGDQARFDVSRETLDHSTLGALTAASSVNLERALRLNDLIGGHLVSGHVDGVGQVRARKTDARSTGFAIELDPELLRYVAAKGSITINGVSLTVNTVDAQGFDVNIVPHTLQATTFGALSEGDAVNIEVDILARYIDRLLHTSN